MVSLKSNRRRYVKFILPIVKHLFDFKMNYIYILIYMT